MAIWIKEVLSGWKWILIFGSVIGFLLLSNQYVLSGINPKTLFIILPIIIASVCCSVFLHRNITLNGQISLKFGFFVALLTFIMGFLMGNIFSKLLFDVPLFRIFYSLNDVPRRYFSSDSDPAKIDFNAIERGYFIEQIKIVIGAILIVSGLSGLIAKVFSR